MTSVLFVLVENPKAGGIAGNIGINNYHMGNPLICSQVSAVCLCALIIYICIAATDLLVPWCHALVNVDMPV